MRVLRRLALIFVLLILLLIFFAPSGPTVKPGSVLVVDVSGRYVEQPGASLVGRLLGADRRPFVSLLSELEKARRDDRLSAVLLRIRRTDMRWGMAQEVRDAIRDLRDSGRRTLAYLETGGLGANIEYFMASAADELVISPSTQSPVIGLSAQYLFFGGLWEQLGAGVEALGSGEYKSAAETLSGTEMSEAHREMATSLLDSTFDQFVAGIAEGRGLDEAAVREAVDRAPVSAGELEEAGLVDAVLSFDEAVATLGEEREVIESADYAAVDPSSVGFDPVARFALVYGSGTVVMGSGGVSPTGESALTSDTVSSALEEAAADPDIDAIIFRVDSPGGSPLASDIIWRAAGHAREAGKPLVASVSNMAASGGYYVLAGADAVVAPGASLIGSIGVFVVRPVLAGLLDELGIGVESLSRGSHADLLDFSRPLDADDRERLLHEIDTLYDLFVSRVSVGRGLSTEAVDAAGRGRVWTGEQARELGLVDEVGGLRVALRKAKLAAGLESDDDVALVPYPPPRSIFEQLAESLSAVRMKTLRQLALPEAVRRLETLVTALPLGRPLLVAPFEIEIR
ncbi:MAG: S49 family peptidase [Myxococcota bacterium]|nr:S49 family peptidase [Myxococcota bacterium]